MVDVIPNPVMGDMAGYGGKAFEVIKGLLLFEKGLRVKGKWAEHTRWGPMIVEGRYPFAYLSSILGLIIVKFAITGKRRS